MSKDFYSEKGIYEYTDFKECHKSKWVHIGKHKIYCSTFYDFEKSLKFLDVFFGLDVSYYSYQKKQSIYRTTVQKLLVFLNFDKQESKEQLHDNIVVLDIIDGDVALKEAEMVKKALEQGLKVGIGCLGGHGRTGWILGYLINKIEKFPKSQKLVDEVRKRLCKKAIESDEQIKSLGGTPPPKPKYLTYTSTFGHSGDVPRYNSKGEPYDIQ
jgi:protein-tyrosine phosphatase